jgi:predicted ArsR family transcriptional regulator
LAQTDVVTSAQLVAAFKSRALFYLAVYEEMKQEFGAQKAAEVMRRAIYKRGLATGAQFKQFAPANLKGLSEAFLAFIPDHAHTFQPEVVQCDGNELEIKLHNCPLKDAWREAGLPESEVANMCSIAGVVDNGTFEGAGFEFRSETWQEGRDGCCHLYIRPGKPAK